MIIISEGNHLLTYGIFEQMSRTYTNQTIENILPVPSPGFTLLALPNGFLVRSFNSGVNQQTLSVVDIENNLMCTYTTHFDIHNVDPNPLLIKGDSYFIAAGIYDNKPSYSKFFVSSNLRCRNSSLISMNTTTKNIKNINLALSLDEKQDWILFSWTKQNLIDQTSVLSVQKVSVTTGIEIGDSLIINNSQYPTYPRSDFSAIQALENGDFVLSWQISNQNDDKKLIKQEFNSSNFPLSNFYFISPNTLIKNTLPSIIKYSNRTYLISWNECNNMYSNCFLCYNMYEFQTHLPNKTYKDISFSDLNPEKSVDVIRNSDNGFFLIWSSFNGRDANYEDIPPYIVPIIYIRRFDENGDLDFFYFLYEEITQHYPMYCVSDLSVDLDTTLYKFYHIDDEFYGLRMVSENIFYIYYAMNDSSALNLTNLPAIISSDGVILKRSSDKKYFMLLSRSLSVSLNLTIYDESGIMTSKCNADLCSTTGYEFIEDKDAFLMECGNSIYPVLFVMQMNCTLIQENFVKNDLIAYKAYKSGVLVLTKENKALILSLFDISFNLVSSWQETIYGDDYKLKGEILVLERNMILVCYYVNSVFCRTFDSNLSKLAANEYQARRFSGIYKVTSSIFLLRLIYENDNIFSREIIDSISLSILLPGLPSDDPNFESPVIDFFNLPSRLILSQPSIQIMEFPLDCLFRSNIDKNVYIHPDYNQSDFISCQGTPTNPCSSFPYFFYRYYSQNLTVHLLKGTRPHFLYYMADEIYLSTLKIKPLFCDEDVVIQYSNLSSLCFLRHEKAEIYIKQPFQISVQNLILENVIFNGIENILWMNENIDFRSKNCIFNQSFCCDPLKPSGYNCKVEMDISSIDPQIYLNFLFEIYSNLSVSNCDFININQPTIESLFRINGNTNLWVSQSLFSGNLFSIATFHVPCNGIIKNFVFENSRFENYNPWNLKSSFDKLKKLETAHFLMSYGYVGQLLVQDSNFTNLSFTNPECGIENNFILGNLRDFFSDIGELEREIPLESHSLIKINLGGNVTVSRNIFENIYGMMGSVLDIRYLTGGCDIEDNYFKGNYATVKYAIMILSHIFSVKISRNLIENSFGCLETYGNILVSNGDNLIVDSNIFQSNMLSLSSSLSLISIKSLEIKNNTFYQNRGLLSQSEWYSRIMKSSLWQNYKIENTTFLNRTFGSTCIYIQDSESISFSSNRYDSNSAQTVKSEPLADVITINILSLSVANISFYDELFQNHPFFLKSEFYSLSVGAPLLKFNIPNKMLQLNLKFYSSCFDTITFYNGHILTKSIDSYLLDVDSLPETFVQEFSLTNTKFHNIVNFKNYLFLFGIKANASLSLNNCSFLNLKDIQMLSSKESKLSSINITNSDFRNISIMESFSSFLKVTSKSMRINNSSFFNIFLQQPLILASQLDLFLIYEINVYNVKFENIQINNSFIIEIYAISKIFQNITLNSTTKFISIANPAIGMTSLTHFKISNLIIKTGPFTLFLITESLATVFVGNFRIDFKSILMNSKLFDFQAKVIIFSNNTFSLEVVDEIKPISLQGSFIHIFDSQFINLSPKTKYDWFDLKSTFRFMVVNNIFTHINRLFTFDNFCDSFFLIGNKFFYSGEDVLISIRNPNQIRLSLYNNLIVQSPNATPSDLFQNLIYVQDQKEILIAQENIFIALKTSLNIIFIISTTYSLNAMLVSNMFIGNNATSIGMSLSDLLHISNIKRSSVYLESNIFMKNYAASSRLGGGNGGAISFTTPDKTFLNLTISNCTFLKNRADIVGGAIYSDSALPIFSGNNSFLMNYAQRPNHIYTYPSKIMWMRNDSLLLSDYAPAVSNSSRILETQIPKWDNFPSGIQFKEPLTFIIVDPYGQICYADSSSYLFIYPVGFDLSNISKFSSVTSIQANQGKYSLSSILLKYPVGNSIMVNFNSSLNLDKQNLYSQVQITFRDCQFGEYLQLEDQTCSSCQSGYWLPFLHKNMPGPCIPCPSDALQCDAGGGVVIKPGYWILNESADLIFECSISSACLGRSIYQPSGNKSSTFQICSESYTGNLCSNCKENFGKVGAGRECIDCRNDGLYMFGMIVGFFASIFFFIFSIRATVRAIFATHNNTSSTDENRSIYLRILMNFLQNLSLIGNADISWPNGLEQIISFSGQFGSIIQSGFTSDCWYTLEDPSIRREFRKFIVMQISPLLFIIGGLLFWIMFYRYKRKNIRGQDFKDRIFLTTILILYNLLPQLTLSSLNMFKCKNLYRQDTPIYFWYGDLDVMCWTGDHINWAIFLNLPFLLTWVIGIPLFAFFQIRANKNNLNNPEFKKRYSYLYIGYRQETYYWEFVLHIRKLLLILTVIFISLESAFYQSFVVMIISFIFTMLHQMKPPYEKPEINSIEEKSLISTMGACFIAVLVSNKNGHSRSGDTIIVLLGIIIIFGFLIFWVKIYLFTYTRIGIIIRKYLQKIRKILRIKCKRVNKKFGNKRKKRVKIPLETDSPKEADNSKNEPVFIMKKIEEVIETKGQQHYHDSFYAEGSNSILNLSIQQENKDFLDSINKFLDEIPAKEGVIQVLNDKEEI